jgi:excinuclease ABC subunit C
MLRFLEREAVDVEFVAVRTEQEALLLENTIIKKRKPRYNVRLKDDKSFLMLRLDRREAWPWFRFVRRRKDDGAEYFGPYASAIAVRRSLRLLHKVVPLRDCKDGVFLNRTRPCIKFEIGRCPAPCVGGIDRPAYDTLLNEAVGILRGRTKPLLRRLHESMAEAAEALQFERAQDVKAQIEALHAVAERQVVVDRARADVDVVGVHRFGERAAVVLMMYRGGRLESCRGFDGVAALPDGLLVSDVLTRFYAGDRFVPREILVPVELDEAGMLEDWLSSKRGTRVSVLVPRRGRRRRQLEIAEENARLTVEEARVGMDARSAGQRELASLTGLDEAPSRIHCMDVSTTQGRDTVASRVCFVDGRPEKAGYRRFRISDDSAGDDFSAMGEAVRRSLKSCVAKAREELPELLVVDGGRGQLSAALDAAADLGLVDDLCIVGLAKSRLRGLGDDRRRTAERLFLRGSPQPRELATGSPAALLLAAMRDEAHRFAVAYHRRVRGGLGSALDGIPGVGPARRSLLLRRFGSVASLRRASLEDLRGVPGLPERIAEVVHGWLQEETDLADGWNRPT